ncbi:DUF4283 domain protein, partial [Trifolium medium]|nr:DUF4283 domain protein [Trifolium medium]
VTNVLVRKYCTTLDDAQWALNGMVASVVNGEAVSVVQNRVKDAGFHELDILPLGADKVFVRSVSGIDVATVVGNAKEFFNLFLSDWVRW